ncbi:MAG: LamB/YcsF family protein [Verrucomicrobia bacterium]|nr:LamB/YcsF family protein [Verrucomicrobiota bacterium]
MRSTSGWDLNCDLGEGEPWARTRALLRQITSANVACGGHAGDALTMERVVVEAKALGVRLGAHPGVPGAFGRGEVTLSPRQLQTLVLQQVGALDLLARRHGSRLHHIKLHGALYHAVENDEALGRAYVDAVTRWFPKVKIYARAGGLILTLAREVGVAAWAEGFIDRAYCANGQLVPRNQDGALLTRTQEITQRLREWRQTGGWKSLEGSWVAVPARTLCLHGDTPGAVALARAIRRAMDR